MNNWDLRLENIMEEDEEDSQLQEEDSDDNFLQEEEVSSSSDSNSIQEIEKDRLGDEYKTEKSYNQCTCTMWIDFPSLEKYGYTFGSNSKYWKMWTIWEPKLLSTFHSMSAMNKDDSWVVKSEQFWNIINSGFSRICDDSSFKKLKSPGMKSIMVRIELENIESYRPLSESVRILASEYTFNHSSISLRFAPIYIIACSGLADILRAVCKKSDILIISGTYKRVYSFEEPEQEGLDFVLTNFDCDRGDLQIVRLTFSDEDSIRMLEKICPTQQENRFIFEYFAVSSDGRRKRNEIRHRNFKWVNSSDEFFHNMAKATIPFQDFIVPIQQDAFETYRALMQDTSPSRRSVILFPPSPIKIYENMNSNNYTEDLRGQLIDHPIPTSIRHELYGNEYSEEEEMKMRKDMPIFFTNSKSTQEIPCKSPLRKRQNIQTSEKITSRRYSEQQTIDKKRRKGNDSLRLSTGTDYIQEEIMNQNKMSPRRYSNSRPSKKNLSNLGSENIFVNFAKIFVLFIMTVLILAFLNAIMSPSPYADCLNKSESESLSRELANELDVKVESKSFSSLVNVFNQPINLFHYNLVQVQNWLYRIWAWLFNHCGFECLRRRWGFAGSEDMQPVV